MRIHFGAIPENNDFDPVAEGWHDIWEPGIGAFQFLAVLVAGVLVFIWGMCLAVFQPGIRSQLIFKIDLATVALFLTLVPIHEFIHALANPGWGFSSNTIIGIWLSKLVVFTHFEGEMSRNRFLLVFIMPFIALGLLPTVLLVAIPELTDSLLLLSLFGWILSCGDILGAGLILFQIPSSAIVRNKKLKTYWKTAT